MVQIERSSTMQSNKNNKNPTKQITQEEVKRLAEESGKDPSEILMEHVSEDFLYE